MLLLVANLHRPRLSRRLSRRRRRRPGITAVRLYHIAKGDLANGNRSEKSKFACRGCPSDSDDANHPPTYAAPVALARDAAYPRLTYNIEFNYRLAGLPLRKENPHGPQNT